MPVSVLVVDDTDHVRSMLAEMLTLDGFAVVGQAHDGAEAVTMAAATSPDVVVMDLRMPGLDGLESTRRIRAANPDQPVILYTAYVDPDVERRAEEAGVSLCLAKLEGLASLERELDRLGLDLES